ncbi:MAG TPA: lactonase family protein [Devosia sp.]|jgi:6-phosphogluconolactonase|nr:lactonase family protein [Devosia sp.]
MSRALMFTGCVNQPLGYAPSPSGKGIASFFVDPATGAAEPGPVYTGIVNPTFVTVSADSRFLAAISETEDQPEGVLSVFAVNTMTAELTLLGQQSTRGPVACHCAFDASGTMVATANYAGGTQPPGNAITVHRLEGGVPTPSLSAITHSGSGPNGDRQERPHAHCVRWTPDSRYLAVVDLGLDCVRLYRAPDFALASETRLPAGSGPRHLVFHPHKPLAYVMAELQPAVTTLAYTSGHFEMLATHALDPCLNGGSGIVVAPGGTHLFVGDRGNEAVVRFAIDPVTGVATQRSSTPSGGRIPRDLTFGANGKLFAVANVGSDLVQLFAHSSNGTLTLLSAVRTGTPTAVAFCAQS